jgi:hypothetical protein
MNPRHIRAAAVVLIVGLIGVLGPVRPAAGAENDKFGVTPEPERVDGESRGTFEIPLEPGAEFEDAVRIYNRTDDELRLVIYPADAEANVDGTISFGFRGSEPKGVGAWVKLGRSSVSLPPRGETVVTFRVNVRTSNPTPSLGAIVVEQSAKGESSSDRLRLIVRTVPANSPTTSERKRSLLLRSPWIILASIGLLVALVLVWIGRRRSRRPRDTVVPAGEIEAVEPSTVIVSEGSRPVLRRLGANERDERPLLDDDMLVEVDEPPQLEHIGPPPQPKARRRRPRQKAPPAPAPKKKKVAARTTRTTRTSAPARKKPAPAKAKTTTRRRPKKAQPPPEPKPARRKGDFIPLDEL